MQKEKRIKIIVNSLIILLVLQILLYIFMVVIYCFTDNKASYCSIATCNEDFTKCVAKEANDGKDWIGNCSTYFNNGSDK